MKIKKIARFGDRVKNPPKTGVIVSCKKQTTKSWLLRPDEIIVKKTEEFKNQCVCKCET